MLHHKIKITLVIGLLLAIAGCITPVKMYEGADLPPEQTAIIKPTCPKLFNPECASIVEVDGKDVPPNNLLPIAVLPGEHEIMCEVLFSIGYKWLVSPARTLTFQADAGHVYRVDGIYHKNHLWIVDETTGVEVAAHRPAYEEPKPIEHKPF